MNNKELIKAGHELAKAISNDTPLIEIAKMVSNLATQLDVQLARSTALAAENAGLKSNLRALFDSCDTGERRGNGSMSGSACPEWHILELTRQFLEETPATDAFLAEVRASAVDEVCLKISNAIINCYQDEMVELDEAAVICGDFAAQLRKGGATEERQSFLSDEDCQAFVKAFTKGAAQ